MNSFGDILASLPAYEKSAAELKEMLLANLVMVGEIPAPTFKEENRIEFLINRYKEAGLDSQWVDEAGNAIGILEGEKKEKNILIVAHADTVFSDDIDHTMQVAPDKVTGAGVADNSLGLSVLVTLPQLLDKMAVTLQNNLVLVGTTKSLGRGNLKGLRYFFTNFDRPIKAGISLEGTQLGRLSHTSIGMKRGEINCRIPDTYDWTRFSDASAILTVNELINHINEIKIPKRPRTSIVLGSIQGGSSFTTAKSATLRFEIRSESSQMVHQIDNNLHEIVKEVSLQSGDSIELDIFAERQPGGITFTHPLVRNSQRIMDKLKIESRPGPSTSELSTFIDRQIPGVTLGISEGTNMRSVDESIKIEPIYSGIAQIIGTLQAIDGGFCEEN